MTSIDPPGVSLEDLEQVAALVDGTLAPEARAALLERMADDDALMEVYTETLRLTELQASATGEGDDGGPTTDDGSDPGGPGTSGGPGGAPPPSSEEPDLEETTTGKVLRPDPSRWRGSTLLRAATTIAAGLAGVFVSIELLRPPPDVQHLAESLLEHESRWDPEGTQLPWWDSGWSRARSGTPTELPERTRESDFRLGTRMTDLLLLSAQVRNSTRDASVLSSLRREAADVAGVEGALAEIERRYQEGDPFSTAELEDLYRSLDDYLKSYLGSGEGSSPYYELGRWAEHVRLVTLAAEVEEAPEVVGRHRLVPEGKRLLDLQLDEGIEEKQAWVEAQVREVVQRLDPPPESMEELVVLAKAIDELFTRDKPEPWIDDSLSF